MTRDEGQERVDDAKLNGAGGHARLVP
ncbi:hypothetical protein BESB_037390 [Besnoitia besnoiti]|uniref:Uncharacterized protein n=1 Tax=Besnoitia besnoiti TaxID=94643 RepID=A0A2A9MLR2_BESBE|nr:hypothetical protein BESB_037390 [Besnoitia besnoiti]PFH37281.1 hypothetical protein BESB_037390 [Besnoitia besnoiti]